MSDDFWREQIAEDDRLSIEGLRDYFTWEESNRREREEAYRRAMAGLHPPAAKPTVNWILEGF